MASFARRMAPLRRLMLLVRAQEWARALFPGPSTPPAPSRDALLARALSVTALCAGPVAIWSRSTLRAQLVSGTAPYSINSAGAIAGTYGRWERLSRFRALRQWRHNHVRRSGCLGHFCRQHQLRPGCRGVLLGHEPATHGFVRGPSGNITTFDVPGAGTRNSQGTFPTGINESGEIGGFYTDAQNINYGFVRDANGVITAFSPPNSQNSARLDSGIRHQQSGSGYGSYYYPANLPDDLLRTFIRGANGAITVFEDPSAGRASGQGTVGYGINDAGAVTGYYLDANNVYHGFLLTH